MLPVAKEEYKKRIYKFIPYQYQHVINYYVKNNYIWNIPIICRQLITLYLYIFEAVPKLLVSIQQVLSKQQINQYELNLLKYLITILNDNKYKNSKMFYKHMNDNKTTIFIKSLINLMDHSNKKLRNLICCILTELPNNILRHNDVHLHILKLLTDKPSSTNAMNYGLDILLTVLDQQKIKNAMINCIKSQINYIQSTQPNLNHKQFLSLHILISFLHEVSKRYRFDMHEIIHLTITGKIFMIINCNKSKKFKQELIEEIIGFIENILKSNTANTEYILELLINNNNNKILLHMIFNYIKYESLYIRCKCLTIVNLIIICRYKNANMKTNIQQKIISVINYVICVSELQYKEILIINKILSNIMYVANPDYNEILRDEILHFMLNNLKSDIEAHYIKASKLITIILSSTDKSIILRLLNFSQGSIFNVISKLINDFHLKAKQYYLLNTDPFIELFKYKLFYHLNNMIMMQFINKKYLIKKLIEANFFQSFINSKIIIIDEKTNHQTFSPKVLDIIKYDYEGDDLNERKLDIMSLIAICQ